MNKDKQILILTQRIELLEKQNEDLRAENQEMKKELENNLETMKKTQAVYKSIF